MKNRIWALVIAGALSFGLARPSYADGPLGNVASLFGAVTSAIVDVPEGIVLYSLYRVPKYYWHTLAEHFGDEKGFQQNVAGALIGIPSGFVAGIPYGAIHGFNYGIAHGWDKPFSTESYIVSDEK